MGVQAQLGRDQHIVPQWHLKAIRQPTAKGGLPAPRIRRLEAAVR
jgi:hypothetical protein